MLIVGTLKNQGWMPVSKRCLSLGKAQQTVDDAND